MPPRRADAVGNAIWDVVDKRFDPATAPLFVDGVRDMSNADDDDRDIETDAPHPRRDDGSLRA